MATVYYLQSNFDKAIEHHKKCLEIRTQLIG